MLNELVEKSIYIIREARSQFGEDEVGVLFSTGKDSTTMLSLIRESFYGAVPFDVIHIDTSFKAREAYAFRDRLVKDWNLNLVVAQNREALSDDVSPATHSHFDCCTLLKTEALKQLLRERHYKALMVGIRRDEHGIRAKEHFISPRTKKGYWEPYRLNPEKTETKGIELLSDMELSGWNLFPMDFTKEFDHSRIHPILHWTEYWVWRYVQDRGLPINPLYFAKGGKRMRSLGCTPCTEPIDSSASTIEEIVEELRTTKTEERAGRAQDKEKGADLMQRLRHLGYC